MRLHLVRHAIFLLAVAITASAQGAGFTGYAAAVVENGRITSQAHGFSDRAKMTAYQTSTIQPVGSVSKLIVGLSLARAVELKLVELDADINKYLDFEVVNPHHPAGTRITLRHLATHTSGILDNEKAYRAAYETRREPSTSLGDYLRSYFETKGKHYAKSNFAVAKPGEEYNYSNIGAALAAYIIERAAGKSFADFSTEQVLLPAEMTDSSWRFDSTKESRSAVLYDAKDAALPPYSLITYPDGPLRTTAADLARLLKIMIDGKSGTSSVILAPATWDLFYRKNFSDERPVRNINPREPNIGLFVVYAKSGEIGHTRSDFGVSCFVFFDAEKKRGRVFIANEDLTDKNLARFRSIWSAL